MYVKCKEAKVKQASFAPLNAVRCQSRTFQAAALFALPSILLHTYLCSAPLPQLLSHANLVSEDTSVRMGTDMKIESLLKR